MLDRIALILTIIGALNWGSIGLFKFDIVGWIFGGQSAVISRIIFTIVAIAGIWCISLLFRNNEVLSKETAEIRLGYFFRKAAPAKSFIGCADAACFLF